MWIQNVALADIPKGNYRGDGKGTILIQIVDPAMTFPAPKHKFDAVHQFEFLDLEDEDPCVEDGFKIQDEQADQLVAILQYALKHEKNVVVHCHAGICRSGAVAEVGVMMGFDDAKAFRQPNLRVKHKMMQALGWTYDRDEQAANNWLAYYDYLESKGEM
jgi:predicted protein tyrosine phosphatase